MPAALQAMISQKSPQRGGGRVGGFEVDREHRDTEERARAGDCLCKVWSVHTCQPILSCAVIRPQTNLLLLCQTHTFSHTQKSGCALDACSHTQHCLFIFHKPPVKRLLQDTVCFLCWHVHAMHSLMARAMEELCQTTLEDASRRFLQRGAHYDIFGAGVVLCVEVNSSHGGWHHRQKFTLSLVLKLFVAAIKD